MKRSRAISYSGRETLVGAGILAVLAAISTAIWFQQYHFNPAILTAEQIVSKSSGKAAVPDSPFTAAVPEALTALSAPEAFTEESLSDKIDGKGELYLAAGFKAMHSQRFSLKQDSNAWIEVFDYEMKNGSAAFSVFSGQRRAEGEPLEFSPLAYKTKNAIFFAKGTRYFELVASSASQPLMAAIVDFGARLANGVQNGASDLPEVDIFPPEQMRKGSVALLLTDGFGCDRLDRIFIANYELAGKKATAFLSGRETPDKAQELAKTYGDFLKQNGISELAIPGLPAGWKLFDALGAWELVFSDGKFFAGVHEADSKEAAVQLAEALSVRLKGQVNAKTAGKP